MPKVSVIIPTYKGAQFLGKTVSSVCSQVFTDFELIIVDDGSPDNTAQIVSSFGDPRIKYFKKENGGVSSARNFGLRKAGGEYVAFLDHDDWWPVNYLQVLVSHLDRQTDYGAVYCPITVVFADGSQDKSHKISDCKSGWITRELFSKSFVWTSATLWRRNAWQDLWFDEALKLSTEDFDAYLRLSTKIKFLFITEVEAFRRDDCNSLSATKGITCYKPLVLERFYYKLGGNKYVPVFEARKKISHAYRKVAQQLLKTGQFSAARKISLRSLWYYPFDPRLAADLVKCMFAKKSGKQCNWQLMPLQDSITVFNEDNDE
jgi:glycosyltransferase involved in cell wall biosynthesis